MVSSVCITGAAGFVAAALARRLIDDGVRVLAWVRPGSSPSRLERLAGRGLELHRQDVQGVVEAEGRAAAVRALRAFRAQVVVHAAWEGVRGARREDPRQLANVLPAVELAAIAHEAGATRLVGIGSQAEYGPKPGRISEADLPEPRSLYGAAKLAAGQLVLARARALGLSAAWVRVFSVYGPDEAPGALVPDLVDALAEGRHLPLGAGEARWDYLHVDDAAEALARLCDLPSAVGTFNLGSGAAVPLREAMAILAAAVAPGTRLALGERPEPPGAPAHLEADVARLAAAIGWAPRIPLAEGLRRAAAERLAGRRPGSSPSSELRCRP